MLLLLIVLFAVGCGTVALVMRPTVDNVAQTAVQHHFAPDPLADILAVREQAQNSGSKYGWLIAILLITGLAGTGILIGMGRLSKLLGAAKRFKRQYPRQPQSYPNQLPPLPYRELPPVSTVQRASPVQTTDWLDGTYD
jgi:hypothetical protein